MADYNFHKMPLLGKGAFGSVYKVDERIAVKVIEVADDMNLKNKALEEIEMMIKIMR